MDRVRMVSLVHSGTVSLGKHLQAQGFHVLATHAYPGAPNLDRILSSELPLYVPIRDPMLCRISWENNPVPIACEQPITIQAVELIAELVLEDGAIPIDIRTLDQVENASEDVTGLKARYLEGEKVFPELWDELHGSELARQVFGGRGSWS